MLTRIARLLRRDWLLLALITGAAACLRLLALDTLPPGLYHDEAYNGLDALLQVLSGHFPLFFEANNGREPLFIYTTTVAVALLGRTPGALRLVSALIGTLTVPATYLLGRALLDRRVGLLAAFLAATLVWTLSLSRTAFRAGMMPLFVALALALLVQGLRTRRLGPLLGAGALYGLMFYTYLAARFTPLALLLFLLYTALWQRESFWPKGWLAFGLVAVLVVAPLGSYFATHWASTLGRAGQVSILNPAINHGDPWGTLLRHTLRTLGLFFYRGDFIPRHNIPWRPAFDPLLGLAFLAGVVLALRRARQAAGAALALLWVGVMLLPTLLAEDAPHFLRAVGVLPVLLLFPALGLAEGVQALVRRNRPRLGLALLGVLLVLSAGYNVVSYQRHLRSEAVYYQFEAGATQLAVELNRFLGNGWQGQGLRVLPATPQGDRRAYLAARLWRDWPSVRYLCPASEALIVLPESQAAMPKPFNGDVLLALWPFEDYQAALTLLPPKRLIVAQEGAQERGDLEPESRLLYITLRTAPPETAPANATLAWEHGVRLAGYRLEPEGAQLRARLYWRAEGPLAKSYTVFVHVLRDGTLIGQHDGPAALGYYPTDRWRAGDLVEDEHLVPLSAPYDAGCQVVVGLYDWQTMQHLRLLDVRGTPTEQTSSPLP